MDQSSGGVNGWEASVFTATVDEDGKDVGNNKYNGSAPIRFIGSN